MASLEDKVTESLARALSDAGISIEEDISEYLAGVCHGILEEASDRSSAEQELHDALEPQLEAVGASDKQLGVICDTLAIAAFGAPASSKAGQNGGAAASGPKDSDALLCHVKDLILMYGGSAKALLSRTSFEMRRNHRYGIVGHNGAGKTTLFAALLSGAVKEMPSDVILVHVHGGSIMESGDPEMPAIDFAKDHRAELGVQGGSVEAALEAVGFGAEMQGKALRELSGGWRMRLALACAMMRHADVLLLDEPTNHLDTEAVAWLGSYVRSLQGTSLIISHEPEFLDAVCTDIIHFDEQRLKYYPGNFSNFIDKASLDEAESQAVLETKSKPSMASAGKAIQGAQEEVRLVFPIPGKLDGVTSATKPILEAKNLSFRYKEDTPWILNDVSAKLSQSSRVAVVGANGAGKSTLLALLCGELSPVEHEGVVGEATRHRNCRLSYIAQHHTFHLEEFLKCTPVHYFQLRFRNGYDEQLQKRLEEPASEEERLLRAEMAAKLGKYGKQVREVVGRQKRGKELFYEIAWEGLDDAKQNTFEPLSKLRLMHVDGLARAYDERLQAQYSGVAERPLTEREIKQHLQNFQMSEEMCTRRMIGGFSAGQKSRLMLGAAFWTKPHLVALDEPTNYLDPETVNSLARALKNFRGGVIAVTHSQHFIDEVCTDAWTVADRKMTVSKVEASAALRETKSNMTAPARDKKIQSAAASDREPEVTKPVVTSAAAAAAAAAAVNVNSSSAAVAKKPSAKKKGR